MFELQPGKRRSGSVVYSLRVERGQNRGVSGTGQRSYLSHPREWFSLDHLSKNKISLIPITWMGQNDLDSIVRATLWRVAECAPIYRANIKNCKRAPRNKYASDSLSGLWIPQHSVCSIEISLRKSWPAFVSINRSPSMRTSEYSMNTVVSQRWNDLLTDIARANWAADGRRSSPSLKFTWFVAECHSMSVTRDKLSQKCKLHSPLSPENLFKAPHFPKPELKSYFVMHPISSFALKTYWERLEPCTDGEFLRGPWTILAAS